jgi:pyruvate/2-oxoglutarate dehydrogenase complex dihydrolipoamide dehydrogenase (E3) component/uncharacterized membrane protein YdjX (TVP38/TMEM64 family)
MPMSDARSGAGARRARIAIALAALAILVTAGALLPVRTWMLSLVAWIRAAGAAGVAVYAAGYIAATVTLLPGSLLTLGAGFAYGPLVGTLIVSPVSVVAATLSFLLGRTVARGWVERKLEHNPRLGAIDRAVGENGLKTVILLRMSPLLPFNLLNYALSLTRVRFRDYVLGSFVGMLPWTVMYVYLGSLVTSASALGTSHASGPWHALAYWGGLAATAVAVVMVTRMAKSALERELRPPPAEPIDVKPSEPAALAPADAHNRRLAANVHPPGWVNPTPEGRYNLVVVGAGTAGLVCAVGATNLGAKVAIVERQLMGGDCLNFGCVPSKALIRAAHAAHAAAESAAFGVRLTSEPDIDFADAMERMRRLRADISAHDSAERLAALGVDVFFGEARFVAKDAVQVGPQRLEFARAVIATGARAAIPPVAGLEDAGYLTNESVFSLTAVPRRTVIIGAGPVGSELGQALARFGSEVTIVADQPRVLPRDDPDASAVLARALEQEGVALRLGIGVARTERRGDDKIVVLDDGTKLAADAILVATGRAPNVDDLGLEAAGVAFDREGVRVDDRLRTTNRRIFAAGDVASRFQFTHTADAMARLVIANALFFGRQRASRLVVPWTTYTDPEVAHVGMSWDEAERAGSRVATFKVPLSDVDRAVLDGEVDGFCRVHVEPKSGRILGATLVARRAGDLIGEMAVAITAGLGLGALTHTIHPYPTQAEVWKRAGDAWNRTRLTPRVARVLAWLLRVRRG